MDELQKVGIDIPIEDPIEGKEINTVDQNVNWDLDLKHIFILSSSGKPIFSKHGDEQDLSTTFGFIQAVVSIVENAGDRISCIISGDRRIVYFLRSCLYFVSISSTDEPEAVLSAQLEFMHNQIIFVLTSKVHDVLRLNPSKDIRDLLGYDTTKQMHQSCCADITPPYVAYNALKGFVCAEDLRVSVTSILKSCIKASGAVIGLLLYKDCLLSYSTNSTVDLELCTLDLLLLANFVGKSNSLRSNDQNWVPICLPNFNSNAYLQAYVCNIRLVCAPAKQIDISLVLISTSADPVMFNALHDGRQDLEKELVSSDIPERLIIATESQNAYLSIYAVPVSCLNFLYIFRPPLLIASDPSLKVKIKRKDKKVLPQATIPAPVQCHCFALEEDTSERNNILTEYQHLALHLRCGSSLPEHTLPLPPLNPLPPALRDPTRDPLKDPLTDHLRGLLRNTIRNSFRGPNKDGGDTHTATNTDRHSAPGGDSRGDNHTGDGLRSDDSAVRTPITSAPPPLSNSKDKANGLKGDAKGEPKGDAPRILYSTLPSGLVVMCVCTDNSELYTSFSSSTSAEEASTGAKTLSDGLRRNACHLFHLTT